MKKGIFLLSILLLATISGIFATSVTRYVSPSGSNTAPYTTLATAANQISTVVSLSLNGDIILIDDGTYVLSSNIYINKGLTVSSINGPDVTIVDGNNAVTCFKIDHVDVVIEGLTIQNGKNTGGFGGGVNIVSNGTVRNCVLQNNVARDGGGVAVDNGGLVENCYVYGNTAQYGGGIRLLNGGEVRNCLVKNNTTTKYGGGINIWNAGLVYNCVITDNNGPGGAGIRTRNAGIVYNSIIYYNNGDNYEVNGSGYHYYNSCTTPALPGTYSTDCISSAPGFIDLTPGSEDYRLQLTSLCIDAGKNFGWMNTVPDLDGNARIDNGVVDMGPYEFFVPAPVDGDGDGVADIDDEFPADATRAYTNFYPAAGFGTLAYEDLWPSKGDYDFNDLVIDYRFKTITNGSNHIVETFATFTIKAFGASFENGFGFQLGNSTIASSAIVAVTGYDLQEGYINLAANGTESGQSIPTIIVYDNAYNIMQHPGIGIGVNTETSAPYVTPETIDIYIDYTDGVYTLTELAIAEFNPFIMVNLIREVEVHLPDYPPTSLANQTLFGSSDDDSNPSTTKYYKTVSNLPWAINIPERFDYPTEKTEITSAYLKFAEWAESGGTLFPDWYQDKPGYRNDGVIYAP
jgi:LruC domain-containing protein